MDSPAEGKEVQLLRAVCKNTFEKIGKCISEERFVELFQDVWVSKSISKSKIRKLCSTFQSTVTEDVKERLNCLINEEKLDEKFIKRSELSEKQKEFEGTTAWRPSGDPTKDVRSHDMQGLLQIKSAMEEYLKEKEPCIEELIRKVRLDAEEATTLQANCVKMFDRVAEENARLDELEEAHYKIFKGLAPMSPEIQES